MHENLFAGLDVSTQSCKLVVIDRVSKDIVFVDAVNYDRDLPEYGTKNGVIPGQGEGVSESDPTMWISAVERVFEKLKKSDIPVGAIRCLSVSGQQHGLVSLDAQGNLTRPTSKLWNDFSTLGECELMTKSVGGIEAMIKEVGNSQRTGYTAAKIFHMFRHEKASYDKTSTFFLVHNYINWYLTGGKEKGVRVMEPGDTSGMALWHPATSAWSTAVIDSIDPGLKSKLPPVRPADRSIGYISPALVDKFGFSADCKIDAGCGDNMYGAVGTGNIVPGIVTISLGTSGTAYTMMSEPYIDPSGEIAAFCDSTGNFLPLLCVSNMANGYDQILNQLQLSHADFEKMVQQTSAGNGGRLLLPWFVGERTPDLPLAAPVTFGFKLGDFTPEILCRAVLEGHVLGLFDGFERMRVSAAEIRLTGGLSRSAAWRQCIADIFEADTVPVTGEGAAIGAALHAAWVWQKEAGMAEELKQITGDFVTCDETLRCKPDLSRRPVYGALKKTYRFLSGRFKEMGQTDPFAARHELLKVLNSGPAVQPE